MDSILRNEDLTGLDDSDIVDVFNIINLAHSHSRLSQMRKELAACIKRTFQAQGVVFFLGDRDLRRIDNRNLVAVDADLRYLERWAQYYCHHDPFQGEAHAGSAVCKVDDILPYRKWVSLKIYKEFYLPQNIHYKLSISLTTKEKNLGLIGVFRPRDDRDFSRREVTKARILAPHLTTALKNMTEWENRDRGQTGRQEYDEDLESFGIIVLDSELRLVDWNSQAKEFCQTLTRQESNNDAEGSADTLLASQIIHDCRSLRDSLEAGEPVTAPRRESVIEARGRKFRAVSSLERPHAKGASSPRFFVCLADVSDGYRQRENALRDRYGLTKREADIAQCVSQGLTNEEIGERLFISRYTVETHLKNIFAKTKLKHRAGLAGLLRSP